MLSSEVGDSWFDLKCSETDDPWQLSRAKQTSTSLLDVSLWWNLMHLLGWQARKVASSVASRAARVSTVQSPKEESALAAAESKWELNDHPRKKLES